MLICCPHCGAAIQGGMTLVRHICSKHGIDSVQANQEVDEIFAKLNGNMIAMKFDPTNPLTFDSPEQMTVNYKHLTAKECEELKNSMIDKEDEVTWGTFGPKRDENLQEYSIKNLSTQHLENILITQRHISNEMAAAILMLLKKRYGAL